MTVRRTTGIDEFERLVAGTGRDIARNFAADRALTKGYAVVRGARRAGRRLGGRLTDPTRKASEPAVTRG